MMHGHEKSDLVIVAMKPANKARKARCGDVCGSGRSGVGGAKGGGQGEYAPAQHVLGYSSSIYHASAVSALRSLSSHPTRPQAVANVGSSHTFQEVL